ncbi:hypothetical protein KL925_005273 [Ogataea polymorpha]|nr:hypothetical protein KL908_005179 [Ogataea polymorpha]KAG7897440.1 hypothetical protein KL935_005249 [Ogataea polymorpha]KAG7905200.1 hypothetical protein KL906_005237 [Ogataea polymorpha]KAG7924470.1 hypothetical protein KL925_005273 [Ogataea polymorpha]KAG7929179.1 hypothetical protein KL934_005237 [Ogataea polymorpha]
MDLISKFRASCEYRAPIAVRVPFLDAIVPDRTGSKLLEVLDVLVLGVLFYHGLYLVCRLLCLLPRMRSLVPKKTDQLDFSMRIVSFIQSTLIVVLAIPLFDNKYLNQDRVFATTPYSEMYSTLAASYFVWDTAMSLRHLQHFGLGFLIHGVMASTVFLSGIRTQMIHYYSPIFLLFEVSTPFLNLRWVALKFPELVPQWLALANNIVLISTFFGARIFWGWYQIYRLAGDLYAARHDPRFVLSTAIIILSTNFVLDILNAFWFSKMLTVAVATIMGRKDKLKLM